MRNLKIFFVGIALFLGVANLSLADLQDEYLLFGQRSDAGESLNLIKSDGTALQKITEAKQVKYYLVNGHLLYQENNRLYEYKYQSKQKIAIPKFKADELFFNPLPGQTEQTLMVTLEQGLEYWYVLDFTDYTLRKVSQPTEVASNSTTNAGKHYSPDKNGVAILSRKYYDGDFNLAIQEKEKNKFKTCWTLSKKLSIFPEFPNWSPDSKKVVFYARESRNSEDGYSLYLYDLKVKKLYLVKEKVFLKMEFEGLKLAQFTPSWSPDSRYLIFEYLPYGLPTESKILRYDYETGKRETLIMGKSEYQYPNWSPSGQKISFISNRDQHYQLYVMDWNGKNLKRLSASGRTLWAKWLSNEAE